MKERLKTYIKLTMFIVLPLFFVVVATVGAVDTLIPSNEVLKLFVYLIVAVIEAFGSIEYAEYLQKKKII